MAHYGSEERAVPRGVLYETEGKKEEEGKAVKSLMSAKNATQALLRLFAYYAKFHRV